MPIFEKSFNDEIFGKFLGRKIYNFVISKEITISKLSEKLGKAQPDVSNLLNGKRTTKNIEQYKEIAFCAGMSEKEFDNLVKEAKKAEYEQTTGEALNFIPEGKINTLEDIDFDNEDLLKVIFKKDGLKEPSENDIKEIMKFIKYVNSKND